jgi:Flp pilus assembly pilin Flp
MAELQPTFGRRHVPETGVRQRKDERMTFSERLDLLRWARKRQEGQTMAEYAVVLGVITLAVVGVFTALAGGVSSAITTVTGRI